MNRRSLAWAVTFALLIGLAIPWFLWGSNRTVAGLPLWLWWHIAWMGLTAVVFRTFTRRAWGLWVTDRTASTGGDGTPPGENA